ncbi:MAG: entericidin A/B family lipoprotein [Amphiplicatus sp.]
MRVLSVLLAFCFLLTACETVKGVGRDVTNAGEAIDDALD